MGKATGVFLVFAGLGTAALVLPSVDREAERQLSEIVRHAIGTSTEQAAAPTAKRTAAPVSAPIASAPGTVEPTVRAASITTGSVESQQPASTREQPKLVIAPSKVSSPVNTATADDLTRTIQKELRRVGCYTGEATGDWNDSTKQSMRKFIERVNATLPVDEPDHILKMLVQGHPGDACGQTCPSGQKISDGGRCLPAAIIAQKPTLISKPKPAQIAEAPSKSAAPTPGTRSTSNNGEAVAAAGPATTSSWSTTVATAKELPVPPAIVAAPLPGRMAIGAPRPTATEARPLPGASLSDDATTQSDQARAVTEAPRARSASEATRESTRRASSRTAAAPPIQRPQQIYRYNTYTPSLAPRRFGPHIFSDTRWGR